MTIEKEPPNLFEELELLKAARDRAQDRLIEQSEYLADTVATLQLLENRVRAKEKEIKVVLQDIAFKRKKDNDNG